MPRILIVGGGAAGVFAAIAAASENPNAKVTVLERGASFLSKVRISGGGRCNVTHACFDPVEFSRRYPRGGQALIGPFQRFQARDTVAWFEGRGVRLKTEPDGRMFPVTDSSQTVIDALMGACREAGVALCPGREVIQIEPGASAPFRVTLKGGEHEACDRLLLATGGMRAGPLQAVLTKLGHAIEPPVPSLFTFHVEVPWLRELAGVTVPEAAVSVPSMKLRERGPMLVTHWGLSGPAVLKLSAWGAREMFQCQWRFPLEVDWLPGMAESAIHEELSRRQQLQPARTVANSPLPPLPSRLWEQIVLSAGIPSPTRWSGLSGSRRHDLVRHLKHAEYPVTGKSMNKEEFVTCGGVRLGEVNFKTMESRIVPGLYFAGEALDIDGLTGGFNFQAAWTTGWIAGKSMALGS